MKNIFLFGTNFFLKSLYIIGLLFLFKKDVTPISIMSNALIYSYLAPLFDFGLGIQLRNKFANNFRIENLLLEYKGFTTIIFLLFLISALLFFQFDFKFFILSSYVFLLAFSLMIDAFYVVSNLTYKIIKVEIILYSLLYLIIFIFFKYIKANLLIFIFFAPLLFKTTYYILFHFKIQFKLKNLFSIFSINQFVSQLLSSFISIIPLAILQKNYSLYFISVFLFVRIFNLLITVSSQYISFFPLQIIEKISGKFYKFLKYLFRIELIFISIISTFLSFIISQKHDFYFIIPFLFYFLSTLFINIKSAILQYLDTSFPLNIYIIWIIILFLWFILELYNIKSSFFLLLISTTILFLFNYKIITALKFRNESI